MKSRSLLLFILFSMLFVACDQKNQQNDTISQRKLQKKKFSFDSCYYKNCPSFVGGLLYESGSSLKGCSASLIGPSQVLTNAHCIPEDIAEAGSDCDGRVRVVFPKTKDHPSESFHCERILSIASDYNKNEPDSPDWAVLELDGVSSRKPVAFRRDGIEPKEPVTIYKVDFNTDKSMMRGRIVKTNCLANSGHLLSTNFIGPISALFNVNNCNPALEQGNSGSAVLDRQGRLVGLFSFIHYFPPFTVEGKYGGGTHGACIPLDGYHPPQECEFDENEYEFLALRYAQWYRQQLHPNADGVAERVHKENTSKMTFSSVLRFPQTPYRLSEDDMRFYFNEEDPMKTSHRYFLHQMLPFTFPSFPECVGQEGGDSFTFLLSVRGVKDLDQNDLLYGGWDNPIQLKNEVGKQLIRFEREDDIYWVTLADSSENTFPMSDLLGLEEIDALHFQVPVCE